MSNLGSLKQTYLDPRIIPMIRAVLPKVPEIDEYHVDEIYVPVYAWSTLEIVQAVHYRTYTEVRSWLHTFGI